MLQAKMMKIPITDNDIKCAERILLPTGSGFDDQRKIFIKNLTTIDLQAVPGSGKTTALQAKLLYLEKHLPFQDGSGVLVISHTNAAVDEIKARIGRHCPRLFAYPSFVGTIQSFVDQFLAIPFYTILYKRKPYRIDDEIYEENVYAPSRAQGWLNNNPYSKEKVLYKSRLDENDELTFGFDYPGKFPLKTKTNDTYKSLLEMKQSLRERGILCFDDAYFLAIKALRTYPIFKRLLQRRFQYVFIDEMQDMDKHQYELLEEIFYDDGSSRSIYQRIGDRNQAIFSGKVIKTKNFWDSTGRQVLNIDGSCRFSQEIANVVQCFALFEPRNIEGKSLHTSIKPHLLIYTDDTIMKVLPKFVEIVRNRQSSGEIPRSAGSALKAIGWRKSADGAGKIIIKNYFPEFNESKQRANVDFFDLKCYILKSINNDLGKKGLGPIRKNILNAIMRMLRYEGINDSDGRHYTESRLSHFLKDEHNNIYMEFILKLFLWCRDIYRGNIDKTFGEMKQYLPDLLQNAFGKNEISQKTRNYINDNNSNCADGLEKQMFGGTVSNIYRCDDLEVEVGTIHSIKGETHTATLYLETYYYGDYECNRLKEHFKGNRTTGTEGTRVKESLKMAYVGMSRPTHLLCVAVHKDRVKDYLNEIPDSLWEKVKI